jgi:hypothetical protein
MEPLPEFLPLLRRSGSSPGPPSSGPDVLVGWQLLTAAESPEPPPARVSSGI